MTGFRSAVLFTTLGILVASLAGSLRAAPDQTLGMAMMSARVAANGNLNGGAGAASATKVGPNGQYSVTFHRPIYPGCSATASISGSGPTGERGFIVAQRSTSQYLVKTYNHQGTLEDRPFAMLVLCER